MTDKQISVEMDVVSAAHIRQVLFEHQMPYSYEFPPERIELIRNVIRSLDESIEETLKSK